MNDFMIEENAIYLLNENNEEIAYVRFPKINDEVVKVTSTYVSDTLRGLGIASKLMEALYLELKNSNRKAILICSYAIKWFEKNVDKQDVLWQE